MNNQLYQAAYNNIYRTLIDARKVEDRNLLNHHIKAVNEDATINNKDVAVADVKTAYSEATYQLRLAREQFKENNQLLARLMGF